MKYVKPPRSLDEQAELLLSRGLIAEKSQLVHRLRHVNYYRVTGYLYPYRCCHFSRLTSVIHPDANPERFVPGTTIEHFWSAYTFDRRLRILLFDAIERIESAVKAQMAVIYSNKFGAFGLEDRSNFPGFASDDDYAEFLKRVRREYERSREDFVHHFRITYGDEHELPPLWAVIEIMSFGSVVKLFAKSDQNSQQAVADHFELKYYMLESWLKALLGVRNLCAHHARLYNRRLGPARVWRRWKRAGVQGDSAFGVLSVASYLLRSVSADREWAIRAARLLEAHPDLARRSGAPLAWRSTPEFADVAT